MYNVVEKVFLGMAIIQMSETIIGMTTALKFFYYKPN